MGRFSDELLRKIDLLNDGDIIRFTEGTCAGIRARISKFKLRKQDPIETTAHLLGTIKKTLPNGLERTLNVIWLGRDELTSDFVVLHHALPQHSIDSLNAVKNSLKVGTRLKFAGRSVLKGQIGIVTSQHPDGVFIATLEGDPYKRSVSVDAEFFYHEFEILRDPETNPPMKDFSVNVPLRRPENESLYMAIQHQIESRKPKWSGQPAAWKEDGLCPHCGEKGRFSHFAFVCSKHGEY